MSHDFVGLKDQRRVRRQIGHEEPRREPAGHERRRDPVGDRDEQIRAQFGGPGELDTDLLGQLPERGDVERQGSARRLIAAECGRRVRRRAG